MINKEKIKRCGEKYRDTNKEEIKDRKKSYYLANRKKIIDSVKAHYKENKEKVKLQKKIYRETNKERLSSDRKKYIKDNIVKFKLYSENYKNKRNKTLRKKYRTNLKYKLNHNISRSIQLSLTNGKNGKSWLTLVPYTLEQLKKHLEKQFTEGMTWENYGDGWHLDHKIPLSAHNFTEPFHTDFKKAWALKNLQPMWSKENMSKGAKLTKPFQPSLLL